jgi:hypothetical protein
MNGIRALAKYGIHASHGLLRTGGGIHGGGTKGRNSGRGGGGRERRFTEAFSHLASGVIHAFKASGGGGRIRYYLNP